jgi:hygromycin-B 7''-O-kinase
MTRPLPHSVDEQQYWGAVYAQPLAYWQPALETIRARHRLPDGDWSRCTLGKNAVFTLGPVVVKICPPFWIADLQTEADTLSFVNARLPVATPELLATGELGAWMYLVESRLPGQLLRARWPVLRLDERVALARQHGALMAAVHALPVHDAPTRLVFDWPTRLAEQRGACERAMRQSGVSEQLLADLAAYLRDAQPLLDADTDRALVHGDLDAVNMLVEYTHSQWQITGLLDWGDATLGPPLHEFISPCVHTYLGERATLLSWYAGYGWTSNRQTPWLEHNLMARAMLYYAGQFSQLLDKVPGASHYQRWADLAACFWQMTT